MDETLEHSDAAATGSGIDDATLLSRVAAGDREAFATLYERHKARLFAVCLRMAPDRAWAEDTFQTAFVKVWAKAHQYDPTRGAALAWMTTVTRRTALDGLRTSARAPIPTDEALDGAAALWTAAPKSPDPDLWACLGQLEPDPRRAVLLAYYFGFSHSELSARLERPIGTVKSWIRRALGQLKTCLER